MLIWTSSARKKRLKSAELKKQINRLRCNMFVAGNADMDIIRKKEETEERRAEKADQQAQMQQAEMASQMTAPIDMSKAPEAGSPIQSAMDSGMAL